MQYFNILYEDGTLLLQEVFAGQVIRYCDELGNTVTPPSCGSQNMGVIVPAFPIPPDPVVIPETVAPVEAPAEVVAPPTTYNDIMGAPLRTMTYDDKGQLVRIDYPGSSMYQLLEYGDGRLRKITEVSPIGVCFERHYYYDNWGRWVEETQL
jgi:hypothetical protein